MNLIITNPLGFWALLGIPAVILIHFLQRQARVIPISTLFLLVQTQRESVSGRRFDRLTNSIPLWLQLLMVVLLTWLLVEPRYVRPASTQQVAIVLDSSASMSVFKEKLTVALGEKLPELRGAAAKLDIYIFESDADQPTVYSGDSPEEAMESIAAWSPQAGATDPNNALRLARSRIKREGLLVFATDTPVDDLPFDAQLLAVGEAAPNVGLTGATFERDGDTLVWKALIRNYSDSVQSRTWSVLFPDGSRTEPRPVEIPSNGMTTIASAFPKGVPSLRITLGPDAFTLDDELPLIRPAPKTLKLFSNTSQKFSEFSSRFAVTFPGIEVIDDADAADLALVTYDPLLPALPATDAIVLLDETTRGRKYLSGGIVAEKHPLVDGLNWQSLLIRESIQMELTPSDEVLLWQGPRPLIALRTSAVFEDAAAGDPDAAPPPPVRLRQLILNFDPSLSNALKLPAMVVLLHRFCEDLRDRKVAREARNTETGQRLSISTRSGPDAAPLRFTTFGPDGEVADATVVPLSSASSLRAPADPGFFRVTQGEEVLLESACHFADTREADLRDCAEADRIAPASGQAVDRNTREDHFWRLWVLLVLAALLLAWHFTKERPREEDSEPLPAAT
ncbi:MAG: hypothetical protein HKN82_17865 [Akkermansiaceae bacterium]|nr:hypothetical protein [Akkermansiaceae bacterium]